MTSFLLVAGLAAVVSAQPLVWNQCGSTGCLPGPAPASSSSNVSSIAATTLTTVKASSTSAQLSALAETKYLITFGDSYSQTGFDINGNKPSAANPLGNPALPGWTASGGLDWVGYMVSQYNNGLLLSYNLANGGATTDASLVKPYASTVLSFIDQVSIFSKNLANKPSYAPWTAQNTLIGVWIGVNDVGNSYWLSNRAAVNTAVVNKYFDQLQTIYDAGARNFALLTVPPTQKTPTMLANGAASNAQLVASIQQYNDLITTKLQAFKSKNSGATAWIIDTAAPFNEAINNPTKYGASDATCYNSNGNSCLWFNDYHPGVKIQGLVGQAVAKTVGSAFFKV